MTVATDSGTPSSHPTITMIAVILATMNITEIIAYTAIIQFLVAISMIMKASEILIPIPCKAPLKKACSLAMKHQDASAYWKTVFRPGGAVS